MKRTLPLVIFLLILLPLHAHAAGVTGGFQNPLGANTPVDFITKVIGFLLGLVGLMALLALIVGGFRMIAAFGNDKQLESAKNIIKWAIIGLVITVMSWVIVNIIARQILGAA